MSDNDHQPAMGGTGLDEIMLLVENPNPAPGRNNGWTQDGYGGFGNNGASTGVYGGGSYTNCSDLSQPGVAPIVNYLNSLPRPIKPNCDPGHFRSAISKERAAANAALFQFATRSP